jgi:hypothetical protein
MIIIYISKNLIPDQINYELKQISTITRLLSAEEY